MKMIEQRTARSFYRLLGHCQLGLTELVALSPQKGIIATGYFNNEDDFVRACRKFNMCYNIYVGRNPRPSSICQRQNRMEGFKRAKSNDIKYCTSINLDIDPIRDRGCPSTLDQLFSAVKFAFHLQSFLGGTVMSSGNGAYLWFSFYSPVKLDSQNRVQFTGQCRHWNRKIATEFRPYDWGQRIDSCYDLPRLMRVIGSYNHNAQRMSGLISFRPAQDGVRNRILSIKVPSNKPKNRKLKAKPLDLGPKNLPAIFLELLEKDQTANYHWKTPDPKGDTSKHDWILGKVCLENGLKNRNDLVQILMNNPHGKFKRDKRSDYIVQTIENLLSDG